ncbi:MAG: hypothetical protein ABSC22_12415 [Roseiarcus sp.]|jgi:hypothetical protein
MRIVSKTLIAATAALGLVAAAPTPAAANPVVLAPVALTWIIVGSVAGGAVLGMAATHTGFFATEPTPAVSVTNEPTTGCYWTQGRVHGVWRRVQVCD